MRWGAFWARWRKRKKKLFDCKRGEKPLLEKKGYHKRWHYCSADGGRDFSLLNKLVRVTTKKSLSNVGHATFYSLVLKFSAWLQTFHAEWSEMTTGRHFYRPIGSNKFRLNPKLLAKLGTLSIKLLKIGVIFAVVVTHIFKGIWCNLSNVLYSMVSIEFACHFDVNLLF